MADRCPLTIEQLPQIQRDLAEMTKQAEEITRLLSSGYGERDPRTIRAQESHAALQRLQWEMDRQHAATA